MPEPERPVPPTEEQREKRRIQREAEQARRDAEAVERALVEAAVDQAAERALEVLPGSVGEHLAAVLEAMKPFTAADGYTSLRAVGRRSPEVQALAAAILDPELRSVQSDAEADRIAGEVDWRVWMGGVGAIQHHRREVVRQVAALLHTAPATSPASVGDLHHCGPCATFWADDGGCPTCGQWSTEDLRAEVIRLTKLVEVAPADSPLVDPVDPDAAPSHGIDVEKLADLIHDGGCDCGDRVAHETATDHRFVGPTLESYLERAARPSPVDPSAGEPANLPKFNWRDIYPAVLGGLPGDCRAPCDDGMDAVAQNVALCVEMSLNDGPSWRRALARVAAVPAPSGTPKPPPIAHDRRCCNCPAQFSVVDHALPGPLREPQGGEDRG